MKTPRVFQRHPRVVGGAVLVLLLVALLLGEQARRRAFLPSEGEVAKVVDGDTLHLAAYGRVYKVRLIGVDCPEAYESPKLTRDAERAGQDLATIMALGKRASAFTRQLCDGRRCRLEYDEANAARGHRDRFERLLAYVYLTTDAGDEVFVNAEILRQGYGHAITRFDYDEARKAEFRALQRRAREAGRGLWGEWKP
ncbi:MAG: thermonuclease family protein [Planctomycetota bacterium]